MTTSTPRRACGSAGVDGVVVHEREELRTALETALADKEIGILLLTEKFGREFPEIVDEVKLHHKVPLIVEIPDRHGYRPETGFYHILMSTKPLD